MRYLNGRTLACYCAPMICALAPFPTCSRPAHPPKASPGAGVRWGRKPTKLKIHEIMRRKWCQIAARRETRLVGRCCRRTCAPIASCSSENSANWLPRWACRIAGSAAHPLAPWRHGARPCGARQACGCFPGVVRPCRRHRSGESGLLLVSMDFAAVHHLAHPGLSVTTTGNCPEIMTIAINQYGR
jgi:hypothetical protein